MNPINNILPPQEAEQEPEADIKKDVDINIPFGWTE